MLDFPSVSMAAKILNQRLEMPMAEAEKVAATFDEYDLKKLVEIDQAGWPAMTDRPDAVKANAQAKVKIQSLIEAAQKKAAAA